MKAAVTVVQAVLILTITVSVIAMLIPWVYSSLDKSMQMSEINNVESQLKLCNEKIEETGRVGSPNMCIFSVGKGEMYAQSDGIYYEIVSDRDICDGSGWSLISSENHVWQRCDVSDKTVLSLRWAWPTDNMIIGEGITGSVYRDGNLIDSIDFNDTVEFITLTMHVEFESVEGQRGSIIEMHRKSIDDEKVIIGVSIR